MSYLIFFHKACVTFNRLDLFPFSFPPFLNHSLLDMQVVPIFFPLWKDYCKKHPCVCLTVCTWEFFSSIGMWNFLWSQERELPGGGVCQTKACLRPQVPLLPSTDIWTDQSRPDQLFEGFPSMSRVSPRKGQEEMCKPFNKQQFLKPPQCQSGQALPSSAGSHVRKGRCTCTSWSGL